jgi:hypothetical protein
MIIYHFHYTFALITYCQLNDNVTVTVYCDVADQQQNSIRVRKQTIHVIKHTALILILGMNEVTMTT